MLEESKRNLKKLFKVIPGPYWGIISMIINILGVIIAILMTPGYSMNHMISKLGYSPGALFFNLGMIFSGLFALVFYLYFVPILNNADIKVGLLRTALGLAISFCIFFILVGVFPSIANSYLELVHGVVSMLCLICGSMYKTLFGYLMLKSKKFLKLHTCSAMIVVAIEVIFLLSWTPLIQWVMNFAIIYWIFLLSFYVLAKKELRYFL